MRYPRVALDRVYAYLHIERCPTSCYGGWALHGQTFAPSRVTRGDSAGFQLRRVQQGLDPTDWKAMPGVGLGVREVRLHTALEHRVLYVAKFGEAVYVLHAFEKRSRKTGKRDVERARERYQALLRQRQARGLTGG